MHSDYKEMRSLISKAKNKRHYGEFLDKTVVSVSHINCSGNEITVTREIILNYYIGVYDFYAHMAKTYANEGKMYLFRKYAILGNEIAKIANRIGAELHVFDMDINFKKKMRGQ